MQAILGQSGTWYYELADWLRGKDSQTRKDQALSLRISDVIEETLVDLDIENLCFYVRDGTVTVFGTLCQPESSPFIDELLRRIPGVGSVDNHLQLVPRSVFTPSGSGVPSANCRLDSCQMTG
jgi:hypothetical protein